VPQVPSFLKTYKFNNAAFAYNIAEADFGLICLKADRQLKRGFNLPAWNFTFYFCF